MVKLIRAHVLISGIVQGVYFRANTVEKARSLGLKGWVRNINNNVEAVFEGPEEKIKEMLEWCKQGPDAANVDHVEIEYQDYSGEFDYFERR